MAKRVSRPEAASIGEYVTLPRDALFEFFGSLLPTGDVDCAPIAERIIKWVESHDLIPDPPEDPIRHMAAEHQVTWRQGWVAGYRSHD